uniref:Uncharacterized protein n=1 Tax=viral metagenome TaxID=1070528 RepID=A0A6C0IRT9_9ZZZZ
MRLNSRIFTNSFAGMNNRTYAPFWLLQKGDSFYGLSKPQYSHQTYYQLANNGAGVGNREGRWLYNNGAKISFIPPQ